MRRRLHPGRLIPAPVGRLTEPTDQERDAYILRGRDQMPQLAARYSLACRLVRLQDTANLASRHGALLSEPFMTELQAAIQEWETTR